MAVVIQGVVKFTLQRYEAIALCSRARSKREEVATLAMHGAPRECVVALIYFTYLLYKSQGVLSLTP